MDVEAYYFGCLSPEAGHNYHTPDLRPTVPATPWGWAIDSPEFDRPRGWGVWHKDGWTAIGTRDRSVDNRPGSISMFVFHADLDTVAAAALAAVTFPSVWDRLWPPIH